MAKANGATAEIEIFTKMIRRVLDLAEPKNRVAICEAVLAAERTEAKKAETSSLGFVTVNLLGPIEDPRETMVLKSKVVCTFVRDIRNNHSPAAAADILFARQRGAPGSGYLADYLNGLPGIEIEGT